MISDMIKFTITDSAVPEAVELMKRQMKNNAGEDGCLLSKAFKSKTNPNEIYMLLSWENQAVIDKHLTSEYDLKFRNDLDPLLSGPPDFVELEEIL